MGSGGNLSQNLMCYIIMDHFTTLHEPVILVVSLDHSSIAVGLASLDDLSHVAVDLQNPLLPLPLLNMTHSHILKGDDASKKDI